MHQTFYIDLEEEISSVIDRLNKSMATDNYFVVPKRAIFLQSVVNLKLLKREADKVGKHIIIITQDEIGASMAQRCGIDTRSTIDGLESIMDNEDEEMEEEVEYETPEVIIKAEQKKQNRLRGVGSNDFYDLAASIDEKDSQLDTTFANSKRAHVNSVSSANKKREVSYAEPARVPVYKTAQPRMGVARRPQVVTGLGNKNRLDFEKEKTLEKMYAVREKNVKEPAAPVSGSERKIKKIFLMFVGLCALVFVGVAVYLFLPSAKIIIEPNITKNKIDLDLNGVVGSAEINQTNIPIRVINKEESVALSYEVKGGSAVAGKKAHGNVVIYNEYDNSPQTLIATTRFESKDGKIFRLVKNVVVPGTSTIAGEVKPGAITAEIIADEPGPDYNIEPTDFTIPGFKGGPKYVKFYAKSTEPMAGGSIEGETAGGAVSQNDIDSAKQKTETSLKEQLIKTVDDELKNNEVALEQTQKITITKSGAGVKVGDMVGEFEYTAIASIYVLVFSENDVRNAIEQSLVNEQSQDVKKDIFKIEYGTADADFEKNTLKLKVYGEITSTPIIDKEQIKSELLGKTDEQLPAILRKYSTVKSVNVEFQPKFVSRIPQYSGRVSVEIKNIEN